MERLRTEGEEHARLLSQDAAMAKEAASAARAEAARARNEAEYERDRAARLQEQLRDSHRQLDALTQSNTKYQVQSSSRPPPCATSLDCLPVSILLPCYKACLSQQFAAFCSAIFRPFMCDTNLVVQVLVNELQQRVSALNAEVTSLRDGARQLDARARAAESEKTLLAAAEQRLALMVEDLSAEKHKLRAQLQVEQKVCSLLS